MNLSHDNQFSAQALSALGRVDFSPVAQVQSVWSDSSFVSQDLHRSERETILNSFIRAPELLIHEPLKPPKNPLIAVFTGEAGAGKTQLLAEIRKATVSSTTQFLLVDMTGVNNFNRTVSLHMIQSLLERGADEQTQLQRVLATIYQTVQPCDSEDAALEELTTAASRDFDGLLEGILHGLREEFASQQGALARENRKYVLRALMMLGLLTGSERSDTAFDWLQGGKLDGQESEKLRIPPNVEPLDIIKSVSWLMSFRGKTILAFDQMDVIVTQFATASRGGDSAIAAEAKSVVTGIAGGLSTLWEQVYRTQILVSCLQQSWVTLKNEMLASVMDRFWPEPAVLGQVPNREIAKEIVELRLRAGYRDFVPPYPTYPFTATFFEAGISPRALLQRCARHRDQCLQQGTISEAGGPPIAKPAAAPETQHLDEEFARRCKETDIGGMLQDNDSSEEELGGILEKTCELLLAEAPPPEHIEAKRDLESNISTKKQPALHSRLCLVMLNDNDREELFCFRAIQRRNARAFQARLRAAITDSGINLKLPFRRLVLVSTEATPTGAKTAELLSVLNKDGGRMLQIEKSELQALHALSAMKNKGDPLFEPWLRKNKPLGRLKFAQEAFRDYYRLIHPPDKQPTALHKPGLPSDGKGSSEAKPPSDSQAHLSIIIGRSVGPLDERIINLPLAALTRHVLIRAGSGGGKTVLLKRLIESAAIEGVPSIVLDPGNDLALLGDRWPTPPATWLSDDPRRAAAYQQRAQVVIWTPGRTNGRPLAFSPLPVFTEVQDDADELEAAVQMAAGALYEPTGASKGANAEMKKGLLTEAIRHFARRGGQTLKQLVAFLRDLPEEAQGEISRAPKLARDMADTLQGSLLGSKTLLPDANATDLSQLLGLGEPKSRVSVISLAGLSETNGERLAFVNQLAVTLFTWIRKHPASEAGRVRGLLVVDEAKDFIPSIRSTPCKDSLMRLAAQARKYGFGMLLATQNPTDIDHKAAGQCSTEFFGRAASPNVVTALRGAIEERGGSATDLTQMEKGQFYFWSAESHKTPSKVQVPMCLSHHPDGKTLSETEIIDRARLNIT